MLKKLLAYSCLAVCLLGFGVSNAQAADDSMLDAAEVFEKLKEMEGTWVGVGEGKGEAEGEDHGGGVEMIFEVSAAGTVVMETMMPGTDHEMINMYHLDGEELVLTHYCAGGNQPTMKLDRSHKGALKFDFTGGTNLDPATDNHIHSAQLTFNEGGTVESEWIPYASGEPAGSMVFTLARRK